MKNKKDKRIYFIGSLNETGEDKLFDIEDVYDEKFNKDYFDYHTDVPMLSSNSESVVSNIKDENIWFCDKLSDLVFDILTEEVNFGDDEISDEDDAYDYIENFLDYYCIIGYSFNKKEYYIVDKEKVLKNIDSIYNKVITLKCLDDSYSEDDELEFIEEFNSRILKCFGKNNSGVITINVDNTFDVNIVDGVLKFGTNEYHNYIFYTKLCCDCTSVLLQIVTDDKKTNDLSKRNVDIFGFYFSMCDNSYNMTYFSAEGLKETFADFDENGKVIPNNLITFCDEDGNRLQNL